MIKIYGSDLSSPANKVRFTANALGLKYDYIKINLRAGEHQKPEFLKIHPAGKIPAIDDNGFILFESNAIIRYLANKNKSKLYPQDVEERAVVDQWLDFGSLHIGVNLSKVVFNRVFAPLRGQPIDENSMKDGLSFLNRFFPVLDQQLGKNKCLAGSNLTLADLNLLALLDPCEITQVDLASYKNLSRWRDDLRKEEFYTKCYSEYGEALKVQK